MAEGHTITERLARVLGLVIMVAGPLAVVGVLVSWRMSLTRGLEWDRIAILAAAVVLMTLTFFGYYRRQFWATTGLILTYGLAAFACLVVLIMFPMSLMEDWDRVPDSKRTLVTIILATAAALFILFAACTALYFILRARWRRAAAAASGDAMDNYQRDRD
jgi:uncharacterized BrkB/YihY/UPF0761 family membrane protein